MNRYTFEMLSRLERASLYIVRKADIPAGENVDAYYSRGIAIYK